MTGQNHCDHPEITFETLSTPPLNILPAPLRRRFGAAIIDSLLLWLVWEALQYAYRQSPFPSSLTQSTALVAICFLYYFLMEWILSGTLGKFAMKLHVVGNSGDPCTLQESALRNLFRMIDWFPIAYVIGIVLVSISDKRQRAGDRIAHTIVTAAPKRDKIPPPAPFLFH